MSARDVIAAKLPTKLNEAWAEEIITALTAAGYRLIGPGELDRETIERCAQVADRIGNQYWEGSASSASDIAAALRSLQGGLDA
jgi:hypothetical protein